MIFLFNSKSLWTPNYKTTPRNCYSLLTNRSNRLTTQLEHQPWNFSSAPDGSVVPCTKFASNWTTAPDKKEVIADPAGVKFANFSEVSAKGRSTAVRLILQGKTFLYWTKQLLRQVATNKVGFYTGSRTLSCKPLFNCTSSRAQMHLNSTCTIASRRLNDCHCHHQLQNAIQAIVKLPVRKWFPKASMFHVMLCLYNILLMANEVNENE